MEKFYLLNDGQYMSYEFETHQEALDFVYSMEGDSCKTQVVRLTPNTFAGRCAITAFYSAEEAQEIDDTLRKGVGIEHTVDWYYAQIAKCFGVVCWIADQYSQHFAYHLLELPQLKLIGEGEADGSIKSFDEFLEYLHLRIVEAKERQVNV